jgi:uncharacterized protein YmfQ (DUF2313 family)
LAHTFARVARRSSELRVEFDPRAARELLPEWETALGLDGTGLTDAQRRNALVAKLLGHVSATETNLVTLAATIGYAIVITTYYDSIFTVTSACTDALYTDPWVFVWDVTTPSAALDTALDALLAAVTPCHTVRRMYFT